jgi:hypothetical protein
MRQYPNTPLVRLAWHNLGQRQQTFSISGILMKNIFVLLSQLSGKITYSFAGCFQLPAFPFLKVLFLPAITSGISWLNEKMKNCNSKWLNLHS